MKKVLIIGGNGSGKSTMARQMTQITGLPLIHLDTLFWTENWTPRERSDFLRLLHTELEKPEWILDGNIRSTLTDRLSHCDTVIYLDFNSLRCFWGVTKRLVQNRGKVRAEMGDNCVERFDMRSWRFIKSTLSFNKKNRKYFYQAISEFPKVSLIVLKNRRQVKMFLKDLAQN